MEGGYLGNGCCSRSASRPPRSTWRLGGSAGHRLGCADGLFWRFLLGRSGTVLSSDLILRFHLMVLPFSGGRRISFGLGCRGAGFEDNLGYLLSSLLRTCALSRAGWFDCRRGGFRIFALGRSSTSRSTLGTLGRLCLLISGWLFFRALRLVNGISLILVLDGLTTVLAIPLSGNIPYNVGATQMEL